MQLWINTLLHLWFSYMEDHFRQNLEMKRDMYILIYYSELAYN